MRSYHQLTEEQRYQIYELFTEGCNQSYIANAIGVHKSTISRELRRNTGLRGYRPRQAQQMCDSRKQARASTRITDADWSRIDSLLEEDWSPEQVSGWLRENEGIEVSHEWIYLHIYTDKANGGCLYRHLRCQKKRRKRYGSHDRRGTIKNRISIDARPNIVDQKTRFGDWEADTVAGKQTGARLVTLVERKSKFTVAGLSSSKHADAVSSVIINKLQPHYHRVHTITYDNGKEFAEHETIASETQSSAYFAKPYCSHERGLNENTNGLLRQYFPKGSNFNELNDEVVTIAVSKLNNRPRKTLGFKTPNQVFLGIDPPVALTS